MPSNSRESSVWRTLAVAFGDGLAFGVALTLTNNAARLAAAKAPLSQPGIWPTADRVVGSGARVERTPVAGPLPALAPRESAVSEAVLVEIDSRFGAIGGKIDRRLAELEGRVKIELEALDARDSSLAEGLQARVDTLRGEMTAAIDADRKSVDNDIRLLRSQMVALHGEFADTLARRVGEQIEQTVDLRLNALREQVLEAVREESRQACASMGSGLEALMESRFQTLREEMASKDREIEDLRARLEGQDGNFLELALALGQSCLKAAERSSPLSTPGVKPPASLSAVANGSSGGTHTAGECNSDLPAFAQAEPAKPLWQAPIVTSFFIAATGLAAFHYLVV